MDKLIINIPFEGFYESKYSGEVDNVEERDCEWRVENEESKFPEELRLTQDELAETLLKVTDYSAVHDAIARQYAEAYNETISEAIGFALGLEFESMSSPREYNFATDRIFCYVALDVVQKLFDMSAADGHAMLTKAIKERFTSYDGFISGYPNRLESWLAKPLAEWDWNELATLLIACHHLAPDYDSDWNWGIYYGLADEACYTAWSNGVDWPKFEAEIAELRADKEIELRENDPDYEPAPVIMRCEFTIDMFTGR